MRTKILLSMLTPFLAMACTQQPQQQANEAPVVASGAASPGKAEPSKSASDAVLPSELSCSYPIEGGTDTARSVLARFGKAAKRATLNGPEGTELQGLLLWGDDPARRIEVLLDEESAAEKVSGIRIYGETARWRIAGLGLGDPLERIAEANGRAFSLWGFDWDYGGTVSDWRGGKLGSLPGGCRLRTILSYTAEVETPVEMMGDTEIASDNPKLPALKPFIVELGLDLRQANK